MRSPDGSNGPVEQGIAQLFALVAEALGGATEALLVGDRQRAAAIVEADRSVDELTESVIAAVWLAIPANASDMKELRRLVSVLLILPELERSVDLAEHIAQRAVTGIGQEMSPVIRGIVQRMSDIAIEMWQMTADAYADRSTRGVVLDTADTELDILRDRLVSEATMTDLAPATAGQIALLGRFYERLGDHAVNVARRIDTIVAPPAA